MVGGDENIDSIDNKFNEQDQSLVDDGYSLVGVITIFNHDGTNVAGGGSKKLPGKNTSKKIYILPSVEEQAKSEKTKQIDDAVPIALPNIKKQISLTDLEQTGTNVERLVANMIFKNDKSNCVLFDNIDLDNNIKRAIYVENIYNRFNGIVDISTAIETALNTKITNTLSGIKQDFYVKRRPMMDTRSDADKYVLFHIYRKNENIAKNDSQEIFHLSIHNGALSNRLGFSNVAHIRNNYNIDPSLTVREFHLRIFICRNPDGSFYFQFYNNLTARDGNVQCLLGRSGGCMGIPIMDTLNIFLRDNIFRNDVLASSSIRDVSSDSSGYKSRGLGGKPKKSRKSRKSRKNSKLIKTKKNNRFTPVKI